MYIVKFLLICLLVGSLCGGQSSARSFEHQSGQSSGDEVDWCSIESKSCAAGTSHVACNENSFEFGECEDLVVPKMTVKVKKMLLLRHNYYRNLLAGGHVEGKPSASRMMQMHWDNQLEFLSTKHVEHCNFAHDGCRATESWSIVGQNIALFESPVDAAGDSIEYLASAVDLWFAEHSVASVNAPEEVDTSTGHFLTMMLERNHRVGCAVATYKTLNGSGIRYNHLITCDYSAGLVKGEDTYKIGDSSSECSEFHAHPSAMYDSLCDNLEEDAEEEMNVYEEEDYKEDAQEDADGSDNSAKEPFVELLPRSDALITNDHSEKVKRYKYSGKSSVCNAGGSIGQGISTKILFALSIFMIILNCFWIINYKKENFVH
ncbi:venom allergen 5-like [Lutzomyia longipalpis]|uniref:venom allergen 5-like n=1 Tax=Lutzomyia longipalpis TaxID=7200 RepID=UPI00248330A1|nr:venom allergen 5-like [Lutzomyia longipalpis]